MSIIKKRRFRKQMQEKDAEQKEWFKKMDKLQAERNAEQKEWFKKMDKLQAKREKGLERLEKQLGKLGNSYGDQIEAMFVNLSKKFKKFGYSFETDANNYKFYDKEDKIIAEIDRLLENGDVIMAVEIKSKLNHYDVDGHISRLEKIRDFIRKRNDNRKVLGVVAGGIVPDDILKYAQDKGLYVLVQNGESVSIADMPIGFKPREW